MPRRFAIELFSYELFTAWEDGDTRQDIFGRDVTLGGEISFCYIDGNHDYAYVARDFDHVDRYLAPGGFILFDDSARYSGSPGVQKLMRELTRRRVIGERYRLVMRNPNYLIQLR